MNTKLVTVSVQYTAVVEVPENANAEDFINNMKGSELLENAETKMHTVVLDTETV